MLKIKLMRVGKKNHAEFRLVVAEARSKATGKYVEKLGNYHPHLPEGKKLKLDITKYKEWLQKGAQPTETVRKLVAKAL